MGKRRDPSLPVPSDENRCTRSDGKRWRCYFPRFGTNSYCHKHHLAYLSKLSHPPPPKNPNPSAAQTGQIWAFSRPTDGLRLRYARIDRQNPLRVTPLLPHPVLDEEIRSVDGGRPLACGAFRPSKAVTMDSAALLFRVSEFRVVEWMGIPFYWIFPKKDEIWAVWSDKEGEEHKVVEVLSDFSEEEGVAVAGVVAVVGVDGGVCYQRHLHDGFMLVQAFARREMVMFSHRIPACKVEGEGGEEKQMWKVMLD